MNKMKQVVVAIIEKNNQVLIVQRKDKEKGKDGSVLSWAFPGGSVEEEAKEEAVKREVFEETGYQVTVEQLISSRHHPQFPVEIFYYACQPISRKQNLVSKEVSQSKWVNPEELTQYFTTDLSPGVAKYFELKK
jgi:mutator protein MutT